MVLCIPLRVGDVRHVIMYLKDTAKLQFISHKSNAKRDPCEA